ncbi:hypothetical protein KP509_25G069400 [Ceratopteris richardii]|uniref:Uncharacterized protein n=1 Tax=Ceratopteris richardii TaxID=49495 RepID=A0A8T2RRF6_CERRI|nr:hypothetical protein KP509_25G069400 [Ceratopteris richardii]
MVLLSLEIRAELENLTNLQPSDASEFPYFFKVKCNSCGEITEKYSSITFSEWVDLPNSRGKAHLVQRCKFCSREGSITMLEGKGKPYTQDDSEGRKYVPMACFDCRGIEPCEFLFRSGWIATGASSGAKFEDIDLTDGEFAEYDEKASCPVGIGNLEHQIVVTK